jgi:uncharacterized RDD family membrane protein YckC
MAEMSKPPRQLDSRIEIVTPENIAFHYLVAGPFRRLPAYLVDCTICVGVLLAGLVAAALWASAGILGGMGFGAWLVAAFVVSWFYFGLFETFWNGQTPGKRLMGLRVLSVDGRPINALQAMMRNVLRSVDAMPLWGLSAELSVPFYMVALVSMAVSDRYQRLGDLACGTIVVVERRSTLRGVAPMQNEEVVRFAVSLPASFVVSRALGHALSVYVARRELFTPARRFEIARTLGEPLAERLGLAAETNPDLLLCALYYRTFLAGMRPGERAVSPEREAAEMEAAEVAIR